ncbi:MAG: ABC transporter ATP-binding protein [Steroidobacteraceae bacterium]
MSRSEPAILAIQGVSKAFDQTPVLRDVNLGVPRGSVVALLGASGSGKTTLLQLIAGLQEPDEGTVIIDGVDVRGVPPFDRPVNMMFQSYALFPHLTVSGNVAYGLNARGVKRAERERLVAWALELTRLVDLGDRRPHQLSGGQRQRVALARCLVMKPSILLLDEPLAALDRSLRADVQRELIAIQRAVGTTFILVTHDQEEAMAMSDYIALMDKGHIVQYGAPRDLYERPASRFVASFLGAINLFEGSAAEVDSQHMRFATQDGVHLLIRRDLSIQSANPCAVGFRPERLIVSRLPTDAANDLEGTVEQISYSGTLTQALIRVANHRRLEAKWLNGRGTSASELIAGQTVHVGLPADAGVVLGA